MTAVSLDRDRLAKLCGLFGSHIGERANAAAAADKLIRQAGLRWPDILLPALPPGRQRSLDTIADMIEFVLDFEDVLSEWEVSFCRSIARARYRLSQKQLEVLDRLVEKCQRAEARAA
jgi:hypothetical protein